MRFWWVNQNQTFEHEVGSGYLWSPKRNRNDARNQYYENMREVAPGDMIFSFRGRMIPAIGIAQSYCYECPKPPEFGGIGPNWNLIGWKVDVHYTRLPNPIRPKDHIETIRPLLPDRYAPLQVTGDGVQGVYLAEVNRPLAELLSGLIGAEAQELCLGVRAPAGVETVENANRRGVEEWEDHIQETIAANDTIPETDKIALVKARRGQGLYKQRLMQIERRCRITRVENPIHLVGSHIKPWRDADNGERLDGENGLLLTPTIDHLFDRGFISFENNGELLRSPRADAVSLKRMGVETEQRLNVGQFSQGQREYLEFHRNSIFLQATR